MKAANDTGGLLGAVKRRPWLLPALFLAALVAALAAVGLLLANVCESELRFFHDLPDRLIVVLDAAAVWLAFIIAPALAVAMLALPVALLFSRVSRPVGKRMLAASFLALLVALPLYWGIFWMGLLSQATGQTEIARKNFASAEAGQEGARKAIPRLRQRTWVFGNGRYRMMLREGEPERYWLVDERHRWMPQNGMWADRVLLKNVARWNEHSGGLSVETLDGGSYELEYATGRLVGRHGKAAEGK